MTISPTNEVQAAVVKALKTSPGVTSLIPAARIYPAQTPTTPEKPFGRYGVDTADPVRAAGWRGGNVAGLYHVFVNKSATIPDPRAYTEQALAAIADTLDALPDCYVERTQMVEGSETQSWHGFVAFEFTAVHEV